MSAMKRIHWIKWLAALAALLALGAAAAGLWADRRLAVALSAAGFAVMAALTAMSFAHAKLFDFLLRENRQLKGGRKWDDGDIRQMEERHRRSELFALQYQINPHFLYNTLDTIRGQALLDDEEDIAQMSEKLARFFRYSISNRETIVRVEEEIHHIEDYLFIQKKRFGDRFDTVIEVETPELLGCYMLKLMLQPLVENAIMHGLERLKRNGRVRIGISATEKKLLVCVEDNGVGMSEERLNELNAQMRSGVMGEARRTRRGNGIAAQNVNARIKLLFGEEYGLHYRSEPNGGTKVTATMPLVNDYDRPAWQEITP